MKVYVIEDGRWGGDGRFLAVAATHDTAVGFVARHATGFFEAKGQPSDHITLERFPGHGDLLRAKTVEGAQHDYWITELDLLGTVDEVAV